MEKHLCQSVFLIELQASGEIFKNTFFTEHFRLDTKQMRFFPNTLPSINVQYYAKIG